VFSYVLAFLVATALSATLTPLVRRRSLASLAADAPNGRTVHVVPMPRTGGVAIFAAFVGTLLAVVAVNTTVGMAVAQNLARVIGFAAGGVVVAAVGLLDDLRGLSAKQKALWQVVAATIAYVAGFRIVGVSLPFGEVLSMGVFSYAITVLWIVGIVNALNLIDGLDGLAGGIGFFVLLFHFVLGYGQSAVLVCLVSAALAGAILGFLFYNFNPASIFMGDSGSLFIGFVLALSSIDAGQKSSTTVALLTPVVAMGVPIMDTLFSMVRRFLERRPMFSPDRGHIHHRLLDLGLTQRRVVLILYGFTILLIVIAASLHFGRSWQVGLGLAILAVAFVAFAKIVGVVDRFTQRRERRLGLYSAHTKRLRRSIAEAVTRSSGLAPGTDPRPFLSWFLAENDLLRVELSLHDGSWRLEVQNDGYVVRARITELVSELPIVDPAGAEVGIARFAWQSERGRVTPETEILLQVVVDQLARRLPLGTRDPATGARLSP
jgi:UDP-GlcNAc:undecaprenyl-phosphate GlcNAc-1-phosphate transferase